MPMDHRRSGTVVDKKHERRVSVGSISNSMGRMSLGRRGSQKQTPLPADNFAGSPREADEQLLSPGPATPVLEDSMGVQNDAKPVYLKGLFSVSTTSTKPVQVLVKDISNVLDRIGIKHRPIRGGFECVHVPSIDLNSVVNGDEANTSLASVGGQNKRKPSLRRKSSKANVSSTPGTIPDRGASPMRQMYGGSSGTFSANNGEGGTAPVTPRREEEDDWLPPNSAGSSLIVRFEIYVVKVSWPLIVIFRRAGD